MVLDFSDRRLKHGMYHAPNFDVFLPTIREENALVRWLKTVYRLPGEVNQVYG